MTLSADKNFGYYANTQSRQLAVKASTKIYRGALVGLDRATGYARALTSVDQFQGIAMQQADNSSGAAGAISVPLYTAGQFKFSLSGAAVTDIGKPVFASADDTLTLLGAAASYIGRIVDVPESGVVIVEIDPQRRFTQTVNVPLSSLTTAATKNAVACFSTPIVVVKAQVWFETKPDAGALNVGTDDTDPDEIVDAFALTGLTNGDPSNLTLAGSSVAANTRIFALVGQASSTAGVGGGLALEVYQLP
jgi:hypothetical protein